MKIVSEVVLPSGRFASMRQMLVADLLAARQAEHPEIVLTVRLVTIDNQPIDLESLLNMEVEEYMPIYSMVSVAVAKAIKFNKG